MWQQPATEDQLLRVTLACDAFRRHWAKFFTLTGAGTFEGEVSDIRAIDYLEYEGLDFPSNDLEVVALVWGQVLARQLGLEWISSPFGDLLLGQAAPDRFEMAVAIWPYARVLEMECSGRPQFGRFGWLTRRVIASCLEHAFDPDMEERLRRLQAEMPESY